MKVSHPVGIEEAHNISVTLPQILSGGEGSARAALRRKTVYRCPAQRAHFTQRANET